MNISYWLLLKVLSSSIEWVHKNRRRVGTGCLLECGLCITKAFVSCVVRKRSPLQAAEWVQPTGSGPVDDFVAVAASTADNPRTNQPSIIFYSNRSRIISRSKAATAQRRLLCSIVDDIQITIFASLRLQQKYVCLWPYRINQTIILTHSTKSALPKSTLSRTASRGSETKYTWLVSGFFDYVSSAHWN